MKTITCRNRTHACICSDAWHTCVVGVTCHQQHVRKDEGKLWYWRHPLGFKLNDPASPVQPFRTCTRLFILFFFFILISFPSFHPPFSLVSPFFAFYSGENFPRRNVSITNRFAPMMFSFLTRVYMIHMFERPFEIASVIHRQLLRIREFICEMNLAVILDSASGIPTARFVFSLFSSSLESLTIFFVSCITLVSHFHILNSSYASSSMRCFVFRPHACLLHTWLLQDAQYCLWWYN